MVGCTVLQMPHPQRDRVQSALVLVGCALLQEMPHPHQDGVRICSGPGSLCYVAGDVLSGLGSTLLWSLWAVLSFRCPTLIGIGLISALVRVSCVLPCRRCPTLIWRGFAFDLFLVRCAGLQAMRVCSSLDKLCRPAGDASLL